MTALRNILITALSAFGTAVRTGTVVAVGAILLTMDALCTAVRTATMVILYCRDLLWVVALFF